MKRLYSFHAERRHRCLAWCVAKNIIINIYPFWPFVRIRWTRPQSSLKGLPPVILRKRKGRR